MKEHFTQSAYFDGGDFIIKDLVFSNIPYVSTIYATPPDAQSPIKWGYLNLGDSTCTLQISFYNNSTWWINDLLPSTVLTTNDYFRIIDARVSFPRSNVGFATATYYPSAVWVKNDGTSHSIIELYFNGTKPDYEVGTSMTLLLKVGIAQSYINS